MDSSFSLNLSPDTSASLHARLTRPKPTKNKNPLLVFIHYWGGSSSTWHKLTSHDSPTSLSPTYPTLAIDLRGWGKSTGPVDENSNNDKIAYSITAMAKDVALLLEQLEKDPDNKDLLANGFILVGHSMGAKVALATLSLLHTHHTVEIRLRGLVLLTPAPPTALDLSPEMKAQQEVAYENEQSIRWTVENVLANPENLSKDDIELVIHDSLQGNRLAKRAWPKYGMQEDISHSLRKALALLTSRKMNLKASILVGEFDVVEPRERVETEVVRFLEGNGVLVSLKIVKGVKHLVPLECPQIIQEEISHF